MKLMGVKLIVGGRVQGVNFRANVFDYCRAMGLTGFVRNLGDGSVEIAACGSRLELEKLIEWIKKSPGPSRVKEINVKWGKCDVRFEDFEIKREGNFVKEQARNFKNLGKEILRRD